MALPIFVLNTKVFDASSMATTLTSDVIDIGEVGGFCIHFIFLTGSSPTGTLKVQGSNDGINFVDINTQAITATGQHLANFEKQHFGFLRVQYSRVSGTGELTAIIAAKRI